MISEWPIKADARRFTRATRGPSALGRFARDARLLDEATTDLFLDPTHRLDDRVRAWALAMRDGLVTSVERDMRLFIAPRLADEHELAASLSSASVAIALPMLTDTQALRHSAFAAILLRRAGEAVLGAHIARPDADSPAPFVADPEPGIAQAGMALLIADSQRRDRFGAPALLLDDLSAELAAWLVWRVAAALRHYLIAVHDIADADADALLNEAARSILSAHDEGRGLHATAARLASRLSAGNRIDGRLLEALASGGHIPAFAAALAAAARLPHDEVWSLIADPAQGRLATLLRAVDLGRTEAAAILLVLHEGDAGANVDAFDALTVRAARAAIAPLALDGDYRAAIAAIDTALAGDGS